MAVALHAKFSKADISRMAKEVQKAKEQAILERLKFIGERFIINARSISTYKDRTGNLRSSIGYVILKDGRQIVGDFKGKGEGVRKAKDMVARLIGENYAGHKGFVLIGVAGMEYAAAVESRGKDVITGSAMIAETALKNAFQRFAA